MTLRHLKSRKVLALRQYRKLIRAGDGKGMDMENTRDAITNGLEVAASTASTPQAAGSPPKPKRNYRNGQEKGIASPAIMLQVIQQALINGVQAGLKISQSKGISESTNEPFIAFAVYGAHVCGKCQAYYLGDQHDCPNGSNTAKETGEV